MLNQIWAYLVRRWLKIRRETQKYWKRYVMQSGLATVVILAVLAILSVEHAVVVASIGATAFIVFIMPRNITAQPRRIIGGHLTGLLAGSICSLIPDVIGAPAFSSYALAVGLSILLMVTLDVEHPPAAGTALGVAITGFSSGVLLAVVTSSLVLSLAHRFTKKYIRDLT